jgi:hypothetical protein
MPMKRLTWALRYRLSLRRRAAVLCADLSLGRVINSVQNLTALTLAAPAPVLQLGAKTITA